MIGDSSMDQQASGTAMATAFMRALGASDPRESIRGKDSLAEIFLIEEQKKPLRDPAARAWVMQNKVAPGAYEFMIARTAFFDGAVERALKDNVPQMVILGAGYDSRPYRFEKLIQDTVIFELDTKPTQLRKQDCLRRAGISISGQIRFVPINLGADNLMEKLAPAGFSPAKRTLFVWEGVTYYLSAEIVNAVLTTVRSNTPPGSSICFDYAALSDEALSEHGAEELRKLMRSQHADEPTKFGIRAGEIESVLGRMGFEVTEHVTAPQMQARYLSGISPADMKDIPALFCLACARVK